MKKLKIAAMISGEPRFTEDFDVFLDRTSKYDIDWYFMLWQTSGYNSNAHFKNSLIPDFWKSISYDSAIQRLNEYLPSTHKVAKLALLDQNQFKLNIEIKNKDRDTRAENCWLMFQGLKQVSNLVSETSKDYDLVIRTRPDLTIDRPLDLSAINDLLASSPNSIVMPKNYWFGYGPTASDVFAIATPEVMKVYCDVISSIPKFQEEGRLFHPETMLAMHLQNHNINLIRHDFEVELRYINARKDHPHGPRIPSFGRWN